MAPVFIMVLLAIGLRDHVGMDWNNYLITHHFLASKSFAELLSKPDLAFNVIAWSSERMGFGIYGTNFVVALIFVTGLFAICRVAKEPWLALTATIPYLVIVVSMSAARQSAAIGLLLFAFSRWRSMGVVQKAALIVGASLFHLSALSLIPIVVIQSRLAPAWKVVLVPILAVGAIFALLASEQWDYYEKTYVSGLIAGAVLESPGALAHVLLIAIPAAVYLVLRRRWAKLYGSDQLLFILAVLSVLSLPALMASSTAVDRMSLYLYVVPILVYGNLPGLMGTTHLASAVRFTVTAVHIPILAIWLLYANSALAYRPYDNLLFLLFA